MEDVGSSDKRVSGRGLFLKCFGACLGVFLLLSCQSSQNSRYEQESLQLTFTPRASAHEARRVRVQHILIAFKGSVPSDSVTRTRSEARELAFDLLEKVKAEPTEMSSLVERYSDASAPGIYSIVNFGEEAKENEVRRGEWHSAFGAVAFALREWQVYVIEFDRRSAPFGYHVMLRLPDSLGP